LLTRAQWRTLSVSEKILKIVVLTVTVVTITAVVVAVDFGIVRRFVELKMATTVIPTKETTMELNELVRAFPTMQFALFTRTWTLRIHGASAMPMRTARSVVVLFNLVVQRIITTTATKNPGLLRLRLKKRM
jgi:hypothetical protein